MSSANKISRKNPLLQRVRRHTEIAMLFRSPGFGHTPGWTAEIVNPAAPQAETMALTPETMTETRPFSPHASITPQPTTTPLTVQRQTPVTAPTLWQRAKTLFRQEATPEPKTTITSIVPQTIETFDTVNQTAPSESRRQTNTDTYGIIQRQPLAPVTAMSLTQGDLPVTAVSQPTPSQPTLSAGDTHTTVQRQPARPSSQLPPTQPISSLQSPHLPAAHAPQHLPTSDSDFPWSPLQAIYNSHHPGRKSSIVNDQSSMSPSDGTAPVNYQSSISAQRQAVSPAVPTDGSFPWGALQTIYDVHQKVARQEQAAPGTGRIQRSEIASTVEPHLPEQAVPLQAIWPVEKTARSEATAVPQPHHQPATPLQRTAADRANDAQLRDKLEAVTPARPSDSSVELVTPRRPRPLQPGIKTAVTAKPIQRQEPEGRGTKGQGSREDFAPSPADSTIETEIGPLPADLWRYIGAEPPMTKSAPTSQPAFEPIVNKQPMNTAVQRAIAQAEAPILDDDTPLPATSLIPITNEPVAAAVQRKEQRSEEDFAPLAPSQPPAESELPSTTTSAPTTAVLSTFTIQREEQNSGGGFSLPPASELQQAIAFAEASPARQEKMMNQLPKVEPSATTAPNQPQPTVAQRQINTMPTAETVTANIPQLPINAKTAAIVTAVPITTTPHSAQPTTPPFIQREIIANPTPLALDVSTQETTAGTAVPQSPTISTPTVTPAIIQAQPVTISSQPAAATRPAVRPSPATSHQLDGVPSITQAEIPVNGRSLPRQTERKTTVQTDLPDLTNLGDLTEPIQRAIAVGKVAAATHKHEIGSQRPAPHLPPAVQRAEMETAVPPESPFDLAPIQPPVTSEEPETAVPDIDELARQVYSNLKRRLTIEWERNRGRIIT